MKNISTKFLPKVFTDKVLGHMGLLFTGFPCNEELAEEEVG